MKKNKSMRAAGGLMIATLLSTSIVSGTYAKYVTSDSASDTARVAKFGVEVKADGTLFDTTYKSVENDNVPGAGETNAAILTVQSSNDDKLVAPGTKNGEGISFSVTGQPEVDVAVKIEIKNTSDVWLGKGTYPNMTNGDVFDSKYDETNDIFTNAAAYYPIKYTLTQKGTEIVKDGKLQDVIEKLNTVFNGGTAEGDTQTVYDANTNLSESLGEFKLTWKWDFDASGAGTNDKQDTLLGDLAAENVARAVTAIDAANGEATFNGPTLGSGVTASDNSYNLNTGLEFTITVTQID
mgnify:CR=1 FL=1